MYTVYIHSKVYTEAFICAPCIADNDILAIDNDILAIDHDDVHCVMI